MMRATTLLRIDEAGEGELFALDPAGVLIDATRSLFEKALATNIPPPGVYRAELDDKTLELTALARIEESVAGVWVEREGEHVLVRGLEVSYASDDDEAMLAASLHENLEYVLGEIGPSLPTSGMRLVEIVLPRSGAAKNASENHEGEG